MKFSISLASARMILIFITMLVISLKEIAIRADIAPKIVRLNLVNTNVITTKNITITYVMIPNVNNSSHVFTIFINMLHTSILIL